MSKQSAALVQRLWHYCNLLRDDGVSYGDYLEQLTYLIFFKMSDEKDNQASLIPSEYNWQSFLSREGDKLKSHYERALKALGKQGGMLGLIFKDAQCKIKDPAKLKRLIGLIEKEQWVGMSEDVKGDAYEGLLEKNAQDTKSGAGQYFTPRPLVQTIVDVMRPQPGETICDPACGTAGFLLASHDYITQHNPKLTKKQQEHLRLKAVRGVELVDSVVRLCAMNMVLHGIGPTNGEDEDLPAIPHDGLSVKFEKGFDIVMTNPPFGKKSSITVVAEKNGRNGKNKDLDLLREDFWATTSNKQLNFIQVVKNLLNKNGRAAVIVPDNVLFESGAGEVIRRKLLEEFDVHTLLRLPSGIFYAQGVKANVLFFDKKPSNKMPFARNLWIYDWRTDVHYTFKTNQIKRKDLDEFVTCYNAENREKRKPTWSEENPKGRWRAYSYEELFKRDKLNLDLFWIREQSITRSATSTQVLVDITGDLVKMAREILAEMEEMHEEFKARYSRI